MFSDISGFTPLSERLARQGKVGAEQITDILNEVFDRLLGAAASLGGDLLSFGGDALLLLFDGPGRQLRAASAAHALREALRPYHRMRHEAGLISLGMSMGAASGPVHLVMAGHSHRQVLVLGPTITRTLRLETAADAGEVLIDDALAAALPGRLLGSSTTAARCCGRAARWPLLTCPMPTTGRAASRSWPSRRAAHAAGGPARRGRAPPSRADVPPVRGPSRRAPVQS